MSVALCGTPERFEREGLDLALKPDAMVARLGVLAFIPGQTYSDLHTRPDLEAFVQDRVPVPLAAEGVIVVETDAGRVYKLAPLYSEDVHPGQPGLSGFVFERL